MQRLAQLAEAELNKVSPWHCRQRERIAEVPELEFLSPGIYSKVKQKFKS
jgi:hypothetical protein